MPYSYYGYGDFLANNIYVILLIPVLLLSVWAQAQVSGSFRRYSRVANRRHLTGAQAAEAVLRSHGIYDVPVRSCRGNLTDHYDPRAGVIRLSDSVFNSASVASIGVAAHEAGHAVQYAEGYVPIKIRNAIIPISQFGSSLSMPVLLIGLLFNYGVLVQLGIILFSTVALFQLVTLPVEFDASAKALRTLDNFQILEPQETKMAGKVLKAAALTYVAALLSSLAQLLRLVLLYGRRNND